MKLFQEKILNGEWQLRDETLNYDLSNARHLSELSDGWIPTPVPGDIHEGLISSGKIKEPLLGLNSFDCQWTENRSWWFRKKFEIAAEWLKFDVVELEMNGLDSNAEIFLNGEQIASHRNAFRPLLVNTKSFLKSGGNTLLACLTSGVENVSDSDIASMGGVQAATEISQGRPERGEPRRIFVRKPQYSFGWDWSPRIATTAIAGDVKIRAVNQACIRDVNLRAVRHGDNEILVMARVLVDCLHYYKTSEGTIKLTLFDENGKKFTDERSCLLRSGYNFIKLRIHITEPQLWWPNGLGQQHLYRVEARLKIGKGKMEYPAFDYGLRFVELDTKDKFAFLINGRKVFCKGANWIPADAIYARVTDDQYDELVRQARDANFNMLRIWGGGLYERNAFYQACDRYGIMVWHDFMFACAPYPDHIDWFRTEVEKEADYQTQRLRHHPCIVLWCGNNENSWGFKNWWNDETKAGAWIYNYLLPSVVQRNCPQIPYWNGSPYGGASPNCCEVGDRHHWHDCMMHQEMEKRITPEEYDKCTSCFVSEFGYIGTCGRETVLTYLDGAEFDRTGRIWQHHNNTFEKNTVDAGIRKHYADPESLTIDKYLLYSGLCQGLMYQYALESMRSQPACHGALFWMYNDCWGEVGWTIIDYYLRRKPPWYFVRRAFAPVRLILRMKDDNNISVIVANDMMNAVSLELQTGYISLDGNFSDIKINKVQAPALERTELVEFPKGKHDPACGLWIARPINKAEINPTVFRSTDYRNLKTTDPKLSFAITNQKEKQCDVEVKAEAYAHAVHFNLPDGYAPMDNYFDLLPGEKRRITIVSKQKFDKGKISISCVNELQKRQNQ